MAQCVRLVSDQGKICEFEYKNTKTAYLGDTLKSGGKVLSCIENKKVFLLELWIKDSENNKVASGSAKINLTIQ